MRGKSAEMFKDCRVNGKCGAFGNRKRNIRPESRGINDNFRCYANEEESVIPVIIPQSYTIKAYRDGMKGGWIREPAVWRQQRVQKTRLLCREKRSEFIVAKGFIAGELHGINPNRFADWRHAGLLRTPERYGDEKKKSCGGSQKNGRNRTARQKAAAPPRQYSSSSSSS